MFILSLQNNINAEKCFILYDNIIPEAQRWFQSIATTLFKKSLT